MLYEAFMASRRGIFFLKPNSINNIEDELCQDIIDRTYPNHNLVYDTREEFINAEIVVFLKPISKTMKMRLSEAFLLEKKVYEIRLDKGYLEEYDIKDLKN